ncbi:MAG: cellulose-binding protein [Cyanobacteria bacterium CRU_2_1]|nr:cellulose-binding protein [Cyanobacteria bacterium RU_5_0]NJR58574.1 cellulose-binding protein [Cyanobacteria bacterium CRU_2_1]
MNFNFLRLNGIQKSVVLVALFAVALSLVLVFSRSSELLEPSEPIALSSEPSDAIALASVNCLDTPTATSVQSIGLDDLAIGTNLTSVVDWSTEIPFIDAFKSARQWIPQCESNEPGCNGGWSTEEDNKLELDEQGWVKSIPAPDEPPEFTRVGTLLLREIEGKYSGGQYVVLYEGEGTIEYKFDAQKDEATSRPGRDVLNVTPSGGGIFLQITATDPNKTGNYIRNIRVIPIQYESTYQTEIFNPTFLDRIKPYAALRFMDWMQTNNSEQSEWADRPQVDDASYALRGVPVEVMIALANRIGANPWFNMPHKATDEYMTNFAQTVKTCLDPGLKAYAELSNEVWNWQFQQAHYALEQGKARWGEDKGDAFMQWYGMRTAQMSDIWKHVFSDQPDRVVSIMGTQTAWLGLENSALDCSLWVAEGNAPCYQHNIDAFAIAGYFSGKLNQDQHRGTVESWLTDADGGFGKAITQLRDGGLLAGDGLDDTLPGVTNLFQYHLQVAQSKGLRLVVYEGGQHLNSPDSEKLIQFFIELNRHPEMYNLYTDLLNRWKADRGTLFMHFADVGLPGRWGSWGALEYVGQENSPKYDALIDFMNQNTQGGQS